MQISAVVPSNQYSNSKVNFGSRLILSNGADFKLLQIARKGNVRSMKEAQKYVYGLIDKYKKMFSQVKNNNSVEIRLLDSPSHVFDFGYFLKRGKDVIQKATLPFKDSVKHKHPNPYYVLGLEKGVEYPSVEKVLRTAYETLA